MLPCTEASQASTSPKPLSPAFAVLSKTQTARPGLFLVYTLPRARGGWGGACLPAFFKMVGLLLMPPPQGGGSGPRLGLLFLRGRAIFPEPKAPEIFFFIFPLVLVRR